MHKERITAYYDSTESREIRSDLSKAIELVKCPKIAIDCGCGAGSDIEKLIKHDFTVYGFDVELEAISRCRERFKNFNNVILSVDSFNTFNYPRASLVIADASLFFCPAEEFDLVWGKIYECLYTDGIFCGSFIGPDDTMASPNYLSKSLWPHILVLNEYEIRLKFKNFEICNLTEHKFTGKTNEDVSHDWHIYSVIARKV